MKVLEILEASTQAWKRQGTNNTRKFRCQSGPRKGRVMASPAACNAPIDPKKSKSLKRTKAKLGPQRKFKSSRTRRINPASRRLKSLNRPRSR